MAVTSTVPRLPQLKLKTAGKAPIPQWVAPPETKEDLEWQDLRVLDLALLDGTPEDQQKVQQTCKDALTNEGFLLIVNHGVDNDTMQRVFDLANWICNGDAMTEADKEEYKWDRENGDWMGYKPPRGWGEVRSETFPSFSRAMAGTDILHRKVVRIMITSKHTTSTAPAGSRTAYQRASGHTPTRFSRTQTTCTTTSGDAS